MYAAMYAVMFKSYACCHVRIIELLAVRKNLRAHGYNLLEKSSLHSQDFELSSTKFARSRHVTPEIEKMLHYWLGLILDT